VANYDATPKFVGSIPERVPPPLVERSQGATVAFPRMYPGSIVLDNHDGDTARIQLDMGFDISWKVSCRLHGIAARELAEPGGREARDHLTGIIPAGTLVDVLSVRYDKYSGRIDVVLFLSADHTDVGAQMIRDGYAAPWDGKGAQPKPPWPIPVPPATPRHDRTRPD
jgi:endonuclease YncB( thermonuclease family)